MRCQRHQGFHNLERKFFPGSLYRYWLSIFCGDQKVNSFCFWHFAFWDFCGTIYDRMIWYWSINYTRLQEILLRICENMVIKSRGLTRYSGWAVYQLVRTIQWANLILFLYFEFSSFVCVFKQTFVLICPLSLEEYKGHHLDQGFQIP